MKAKHYIIFLIFIIFLQSCHKKSTPPESISFNKHIKLNNLDINLKNDLLIQPMFIRIKDSILYAMDRLNTKGVIHLISLKDFSLIQSIGLLGKGPKEIVMASMFNIHNDYIWICDGPGSKYLGYKIKDVFNNVKEPSKVIKIDNVQVLSYPVIEGNYIYYQGGKDSYAVNILNWKSKEIEKKIGKFKCDSSFSFIAAYQYYDPIFSKHPHKDFFATGYRNFDIIDIHRNGKNMKLKGKAEIEPEGTNYGYNYIKNPNSKTAYLSIKSDENFIYALYLGKIWRDPKRPFNALNHPKTLQVLTWEGESIAEIQLNNPVHDFDIDLLNKRIITINPLNENLFDVYEFPDL